MQIYSYPDKNVSFEALKYKNINGISIPDDFKVCLPQINGNYSDCFVKSRAINNLNYQDYSVLVTSNNREVGHCLFDYLGSNTFYITTINNYTNSIKGIGSVLHLTQIITMLENGADNVKLFSLGSAINFHAKLGFKSNIQTKSDVTNFLINEISMKHWNDKKFSGIMDKVKTWFADKESADSQKIESGNKIIDDFVQTINENKLKYGIDYQILTGIKMKLKKEDILSNKDYFNNLLNKYGIDYQIAD